ncbi:MAG: CARDB domain-containing protein [bacterium]
MALVAGCDDSAPGGGDPRADGEATDTRPPGADGAPPDAGPPADAAPDAESIDQGAPDDADRTDAEPTDAEPTDAAPEAADDPCAPDPCPPGEACNRAPDGTAACEPADCFTLGCDPGEMCRPTPGGGGECVQPCETDRDCPAEQHCDAICVDDLCVPGARRCAGDIVEQCADNGSGYFDLFICDSPVGGFVSTCEDALAGRGACTCREEWDCAEHLACNGGTCQGTGAPPACRLDPAPFAESRPTREIAWGGTAADRNAVGRPFPQSSHASMTPIVANLDDDNGDGLIDARDHPEIVFTTYCNSDISANGALRAIRGGGPLKGRDAFAVLGPHHWRAGDPMPAAPCADGVLNSTAALAVADLDDPATSDGRPEIIAVYEGGGVVVYDHTGAELTRAFAGQTMRAQPNPALAIANLDGRGMAEVIMSPYVITFARTAAGALEAVDLFTGALSRGSNGQGPIACVADLLGDPRPEIIAGATAYALPDPPPGATRRADCVANGGAIEPADADEQAYCAGELAVRWDAGPRLPAPQREGFCAVADVLGADPDAPTGPENPLDGIPEVILIAEGTLQILDGPTGALRPHPALVNAGSDGGAPTVDDFDGDGYPEIGSAFGTRYVVLDLQPPTDACPAWPVGLADDMPPPAGNTPREPGGDCAGDGDCAPGAVCDAGGRCLCLHNAWQRVTEDDSSRVTGSTVFDFNGDGAAEVVYNDECFFRIYDGRTGDVLVREPAHSRTRIENAVVADVDNDGNAEIAFTTNAETNTCSRGNAASTNGLEVWGDAADRWISARRIWHQHAYHITEITEAGAVPLVEPQGWIEQNGRRYNTWRSQPRSDNIAPDLTVARVQFRSPDIACGALSGTLDLSATIASVGDLRSGPDVSVAFEGTWDGLRRPLTGPDGAPLVVALTESLEPGATTIARARYDIAANGDDPDRLPDRVDVIVDAGGDPAFGRQRECREDNNAAGIEIVAPDAMPDLRLDAVAAAPGPCPQATLTATVHNDGAVPAPGVVVRFYAGLPALGQVLGELDAGAIGPGEAREVMLAADTLTPGRAVIVYAVADPDDRVAECSDGDNIDRAPAAITCAAP